jgi:sialidase-1
MPVDRDAICVLLAEATPGCPRQTEASILPLGGGRLLAAWSDFHRGQWRDEGAARILGRWSEDQGRSWGEPFVLQENIGRLNVMSASLVATAAGRLLLAFGRKDGQPGHASGGGAAVLDAMVRHSDDGGRSWSEPRNITPGGRYWCITNDRLVRLRSGRILYPLAEREAGCHVWCCDDAGATWHMSRRNMHPADGAAYEEPAVVERADGSVLMVIRTSTGNLHLAVSDDGGMSWTAWKTGPADQCGRSDSGPCAARAPAMVRRLPDSDDLVLLWNPGSVRTPLASALSSDGGASWHSVRCVEPMDLWPPRLTHAYPSLAFQAGWAHLTYWETHAHPTAERLLHLRYRRLPIDWFGGLTPPAPSPPPSAAGV